MLLQLGQRVGGIHPQHARFAVGAPSLPRGVAVERALEARFRLEQPPFGEALLGDVVADAPVAEERAVGGEARDQLGLVEVVPRLRFGRAEELRFAAGLDDEHFRAAVVGGPSAAQATLKMMIYTLIGSLLVFGSFTWIAAYAGNLSQMFWLRLVAGLGIGGVMMDPGWFDGGLFDPDELDAYIAAQKR